MANITLAVANITTLHPISSCHGTVIPDRRIRINIRASSWYKKEQNPRRLLDFIDPAQLGYNL